jgi:hypothetical protein
MSRVGLRAVPGPQSEGSAMSAVQLQSDAERLLASLLREQRPAPPALDADLAAQFAKAVMRELQAQQPTPAAMPEPTKPRKRARTAIFDGVVLAIIAFVALAVLCRAFGPLGIAIDPPAQVASTAVPTTGLAHTTGGQAAGDEQQPALTTPVSASGAAIGDNNPAAPAPAIGERPNLNAGPAYAPVPTGETIVLLTAAPIIIQAQGERISGAAAPEPTVVKLAPGGRANLNAGPGARP